MWIRKAAFNVEDPYTAAWNVIELKPTEIQLVDLQISLRDLGRTIAGLTIGGDIFMIFLATTLIPITTNITSTISEHRSEGTVDRKSPGTFPIVIGAVVHRPGNVYCKCPVCRGSECSEFGFQALVLRTGEVPKTVRLLQSRSYIMPNCYPTTLKVSRLVA